jgi:CMP-N,N'-diacetyllegionaminic acid synthase
VAGSEEAARGGGVSYVLALIGARSGSSLKDKNVRPLAGHPLLAYSVMAARKADGIDRVIVSTDSTEYADIAKYYGAEAPFMRDASISRDDSPDSEYVLFTLGCMYERHEAEPTLIALLRPTTPLREPAMISGALLAFSQSRCCSSRSVHEESESSFKSFERVDGKLRGISDHAWQYDIDTFSGPRQLFPRTYKANGYVDVLKRDFVIRSQKLYGHPSSAFVTDPITEADTEEDFEYLEWQVARRPELVKRLFG